MSFGSSASSPAHSSIFRTVFLDVDTSEPLNEDLTDPLARVVDQTLSQTVGYPNGKRSRNVSRRGRVCVHLSIKNHKRLIFSSSRSSVLSTSPNVALLTCRLVPANKGRDDLTRTQEQPRHQYRAVHRPVTLDVLRIERQVRMEQGLFSCQVVFCCSCGAVFRRD